MPQRRHDALWNLIGWAALGMTAGLTAGVFLGQWLRPRGRPDDRPRGTGAGTIAQTAEAATTAFNGHAQFASLGITLRALAPGVIEVGGWVGDRKTRTMVVRFAQSIPGIRDVLDSVLVHGEDDINLRHHWSHTNRES